MPSHLQACMSLAAAAGNGKQPFGFWKGLGCDGLPVIFHGRWSKTSNDVNCVWITFLNQAVYPYFAAA